jgi:hypothetical protein
MTIQTILSARGYQPAPAMNYRGAPQVVFDKPDDLGTDTRTDEQKAAAAEAEARAAADAAAADAARAAEAEAAAKAAGDAEAAQIAEDAKKAAEDLAREKADLLKEVMDKKNKLKTAEQKAADAAAALAAYEGVDPAKVKALLKAEAEAEKAAAEAKGDFERVKQMMAEEHAKDIKTKDDRIAELEALVAGKDNTINELTVGSAFSGSTFIKDDLLLTPTKARALYGAHFAIEDGKTVGYDKPAGAANRTKLVSASGDPLPFDEAFKRIIEADPEKDTLLKVKTKPGSQSNTRGELNTQDKPKGELFGAARILAGMNKGK